MSYSPRFTLAYPHQLNFVRSRATARRRGPREKTERIICSLAFPAQILNLEKENHLFLPLTRGFNTQNSSCSAYNTQSIVINILPLGHHPPMQSRQYSSVGLTLRQSLDVRIICRRLDISFGQDTVRLDTADPSSDAAFPPSRGNVRPKPRGLSRSRER